MSTVTLLVFCQKAPTTGTRLYVIYEEEGNFEDEKSGGRKRKAIEMEEIVECEKAIEMEEMVQSAHGDLGDLVDIDLILTGSSESEYWYFK